MKTKGARKVLDRLYGLLDYEHELAERARALAKEGYKVAVFNPKYAQDLFTQLDQIEAERAATLADIKALVTGRVEPYMERANPTVDQRLADIEQRLADLESRSQGSSEPRMQLIQKTKQQ